MPLAPNTKLGQYEVVEAIGAGGMGEVYRARDTKLDRDVALKVLPSEFSGDPERIARLDREARLLASFQHPGIASIYGYEHAEGVRFLTMELVEGEDLSERLQRGPIPLQEAIEIAEQVAIALEAAHRKNIIHRDLKPANIKVDQDGVVKVLAHQETDEILGVHICGPRAADMIAEAVVAMEYRASAEDIARMSHAHPTFTEAVKEAALAATGDRALHI